MFSARQGDVLIREVAEVPEGAKPVARDRGRVVLAYGEVTGHAHAIADRDVELLSVSGQVDRWLRVRSQAVLAHEEHSALEIPPGIYRVVTQREWSDADAIRVLD